MYIFIAQISDVNKRKNKYNSYKFNESNVIKEFDGLFDIFISVFKETRNTNFLGPVSNLVAIVMLTENYV